MDIPLIYIFWAFFIYGVYLLLKLIIFAYWKTFFYTKQGALRQFVPFIGFFGKAEASLSQTNDTEALFKSLIKSNPDMPMMVTNFGSSVLLILLDPALIKELYLNQDHYIKADLAAEVHKQLLGEGLLLSEGSKWKKHRKLLSTKLDYESLKWMIPTILDTTRQCFDMMEKEGLKNIHIMEQLHVITGEVVGRIFFSENLQEKTFEGQALSSALAQIVIDASNFNRHLIRVIFGVKMLKIFPSYRRFMQRVDRFKQKIYEVIAERKISRKQNKSQKKDLLNIFLDTQTEDSENSMSDQEILDNFITLFLAGMDTTGHFLTLVTYQMLQHPDCLTRLEYEVDEIYSKKSRDEITIELINKFEYMPLVMNETFRLITPVTGIFPRLALDDHNLGRVRIKKDTILALNYTMNNHNPKYYESPEKFIPERWEKNNKSLDNYLFTPFSAGPRHCVGKHMSLLESKIILSEFIKRYRYKSQPDYKLIMHAPFLYEPLNPVRYDLEKKIGVIYL